MAVSVSNVRANPSKCHVIIFRSRSNVETRVYDPKLCVVNSFIYVVRGLHASPDGSDSPVISALGGNDVIWEGVTPPI